MQAIAADNNLPETAFFVPAGEAGSFELRWFTPTTEVDLCGHATLATAVVIATELQPELERLDFTTERAGKLVVSRTGARFTLDLPARPPAPCEAHPDLHAALGGPEPELVLAARDYLVVYRDAPAIAALAPDLRRVAALDRFAVCVTAPGEQTDFVSRFFAPARGVDEDPVTGSAHCTLTPYWAERLGRSHLSAAQLSRRGGELDCELAGDRVHLTGSVVPYLAGHITV